MGVLVITQQEGVLVVTLPRECSNFDVDELRQAERRVLDAVDRMADLRGVVFDLSQTDFLGTHCLETMLRVMKRVAQKGGKTIITGLHGPVKELFEMTRLVTIFPQADSLDAAIAAARSAS